MTLNAIEQQRLEEGIRGGRAAHYPLHHWRFYFSYLLGRSVSLAETEAFLVDEAHAQRTLTQGQVVPV